jgi:hypothetical protein
MRSGKTDRKILKLLLSSPHYYYQLTSDGVQMMKIAYIGEPGLFRSAVNQVCDYVKMGKACKF